MKFLLKMNINSMKGDVLPLEFSSSILEGSSSLIISCKEIKIILLESWWSVIFKKLRIDHIEVEE